MQRLSLIQLEDLLPWMTMCGLRGVSTLLSSGGKSLPSSSRNTLMIMCRSRMCCFSSEIRSLTTSSYETEERGDFAADSVSASAVLSELSSWQNISISTCRHSQRSIHFTCSKISKYYFIQNYFIRLTFFSD